MPSPSNAFIARSLHYLVQDYFPKIQRCLEQLTEEDIWWKPNSRTNSIGNLMLHLSGNARQWVVSGIGKAPDTRERSKEFAAEGPMPVAELMDQLHNTLDDVTGVLSALSPDRLSETLTIQGNDVTVQEALYHVVEHFSMHTGQIIYITKLRCGKDLAFYVVDEKGDAYPNW